MAERRGVGGWGSRPVWPNDQQIFCALFRCNADHALVLSAAAKRPCWCLPILQRSVLQMKSGLSTRPRLRRPSLEKTSDLFHQEAGSGRETEKLSDSERLDTGRRRMLAICPARQT